MLIWKTCLPTLCFHNVSLIKYLTKYVEKLRGKGICGADGSKKDLVTVRETLLQTYPVCDIFLQHETNSLAFHMVDSSGQIIGWSGTSLERSTFELLSSSQLQVECLWRWGRQGRSWFLNMKGSARWFLFHGLDYHNGFVPMFSRCALLAGKGPWKQFSSLLLIRIKCDL